MPSPVHPYSDYGVAMRTLKSSRGWLGFMLFACVLSQFIGFALMWWTPQPYEGMKGQWRASPERPSIPLTVGPELVPRTQPFVPDTNQSLKLNIRNQWNAAYTMFVPVTQICSLIAVASQVIIVFVTLLVILIAQAPGVAQITRGLIWSVLLLFMFFPWQYFARDFPVRGIIYSYKELLDIIGPEVAGDRVSGFQTLLVYARFILWPLVGLFVLLITSERYRAGVMIAIGHPLQSILQPRGGSGLAVAPGVSPAPKPRIMSSVSGKIGL